MQQKKIWVTAPWKIGFKKEGFNESITHPKDIIVESHYTHLSAGTEMACLSGLEDWFPFPNIPGYTAIGKVLEKGNEVTDAEVGDIIYTMGPHASHFKVNQDDRFHGVCVKVPKGLDPDIASYVHMGGIAMSALRASSIELGDYVAVSGMGTIGNLAAQFAQLQGARVLAIDITDNRLKMANDCGLKHTFNSKDGGLEEAVNEFTNGAKVSTWIDATGLSAVVNEAVNHVAARGEVVLLGSPRASFETDITPLLRKVHLIEGIELKGALEFLWPTFENEFVKHSIERNSRIIFELMRDGQLNVAPFYTHKLHPAEAEKAYKGLRDNPDEYTGVVFDWTQL